jgi:hypothetical protein
VSVAGTTAMNVSGLGPAAATMAVMGARPRLPSRPATAIGHRAVSVMLKSERDNVEVGQERGPMHNTN